MKFVDKRLIGLRKIPFSEKIVKVGCAYIFEYEYGGAHWKVRKFIGLCISVRNKGLQSTVTLVNVINGVRVEFAFGLFSPNILRIVKLPIYKFKKLRRAKLFLLRNKRELFSRIVVSSF
jgi:ribosomal protein L19